MDHCPRLVLRNSISRRISNCRSWRGWFTAVHEAVFFLFDLAATYFVWAARAGFTDAKAMSDFGRGREVSAGAGWVARFRFPDRRLEGACPPAAGAAGWFDDLG